MRVPYVDANIHGIIYCKYVWQYFAVKYVFEVMLRVSLIGINSV